MLSFHAVQSAGFDTCTLQQTASSIGAAGTTVAASSIGTASMSPNPGQEEKIVIAVVLSVLIAAVTNFTVVTIILCMCRLRKRFQDTGK
jgi:hypothetical protein